MSDEMALPPTRYPSSFLVPALPAPVGARADPAITRRVSCVAFLAGGTGRAFWASIPIDGRGCAVVPGEGRGDVFWTASLVP